VHSSEAEAGFSFPAWYGFQRTNPYQYAHCAEPVQPAARSNVFCGPYRSIVLQPSKYQIRQNHAREIYRPGSNHSTFVYPNSSQSLGWRRNLRVASLSTRARPSKTIQREKKSKLCAFPIFSLAVIKESKTASGASALDTESGGSVFRDVRQKNASRLEGKPDLPSSSTYARHYPLQQLPTGWKCTVAGPLCWFKVDMGTNRVPRFCATVLLNGSSWRK